MKPLAHRLFFIFLTIALSNCGVYNFTGSDVGNAQTFQVGFFQNNAPIVEPGLDRDFTNFLQDLILNQTNLSLVTSNGDLDYAGEIVEFNIAPMSATAQQTAAQNRLTITVNVRFANHQNSDKDFEKRFSFFYDFPAAQQLNQVKVQAFQAIFERIGQDIFNASLANW